MTSPPWTPRVRTSSAVVVRPESRLFLLLFLAFLGEQNGLLKKKLSLRNRSILTRNKFVYCSIKTEAFSLKKGKNYEKVKKEGGRS